MKNNDDNKKKQQYAFDSSSSSMNASVRREKSDTKSKNDTNKSRSDNDILKFHSTLQKDVPTVPGFVYMTIPPDGGYGWIVLISSFFVLLITEGIHLSLSRILPSLTSDLNITEKGSALIASFQSFFFYFVDPVACAFVNKFGFRPIGIFGSVAALIGVLVGSFSSDIISIILFMSVLMISGLAVSNLVSQLIISFYFDKYRSIAVGLASSGSGVGLLLMSPLISYLSETFGWRTAMRFEFGLCVLIFGLIILFRPVQPTRIGRFIMPKENELSIESNESFELASSRYSGYLVNVESNINKMQESIRTQNNDIDSSDKGCCGNLFSCCIKTKPGESLQQEEVVIVPIGSERSIAEAASVIRATTSSQGNVPKQYVIRSDPLDREDIFYTGRLNYERGENITFDNDNIEIVQGKEEQAKAINYTLSVTRNVMNEQAASTRQTALCKLHPKIEAAINLLFDKKLLKLWEFQLLVAGSFFYLMGAGIPMLYITQRAEIPENYSNWLLSSVGLTNFIIRLSSGFFVFFFPINPLYVTGFPFLFCGLLSIISAYLWKDSVGFQFFYAVIYGTSLALYASLRSIIFVKLLGLKNLTNAFGLASLASGISMFIGYNFSGALITYTGSLEFSFIFAGISIAISGIISLILPTLIKQAKKKKDKQEQEEEELRKKVRFSASTGNIAQSSKKR